MILSKTLDDRKSALEKILPYQKNDFFQIFKIMNSLPVTVRLLDPPLHEFLPNSDSIFVQESFNPSSALEVLGNNKKNNRM